MSVERLRELYERWQDGADEPERAAIAEALDLSTFAALPDLLALYDAAQELWYVSGGKNHGEGQEPGERCSGCDMPSPCLYERMRLIFARLDGASDG